MSQAPADPAARVRLDKWLWAARFYKTRAQAADAIKGGKVQVNGVRAKAGKEVLCGMMLDINLGEITRTVVVLALSSRRGPATVATTLYKETEDSRQRNQAIQEQRKLLAASMPRPTGKPSKRDRRHIVRFTRRSE